MSKGWMVTLKGRESRKTYEKERKIENGRNVGQTKG